MLQANEYFRVTVNNHVFRVHPSDLEFNESQMVDAYFNNVDENDTAYLLQFTNYQSDLNPAHIQTDNCRITIYDADGEPVDGVNITPDVCMMINGIEYKLVQADISLLDWLLNCEDKKTRIYTHYYDRLAYTSPEGCMACYADNHSNSWHV